MKIVWTKLALQDLNHIGDYIALDDPEAADQTLHRLDVCVANLLNYPNLGHVGRVKGTRELVVFGTPYIVPYRVKKDQIQVLAVIHGSRRWPGIL